MHDGTKARAMFVASVALAAARAVRGERRPRQVVLEAPGEERVEVTDPGIDVALPHEAFRRRETRVPVPPDAEARVFIGHEAGGLRVDGAVDEERRAEPRRDGRALEVGAERAAGEHFTDARVDDVVVRHVVRPEIQTWLGCETRIFMFSKF